MKQLGLTFHGEPTTGPWGTGVLLEDLYGNKIFMSQEARRRKGSQIRRAVTMKKETRDWGHNRDMWIRVLENKTGKGLEHWNAVIKKQMFTDASSLKAWLAQQGVTGYARQLLVMETFGYPDFVTTSADSLIAAQYEDRPHLRSIYAAIVRDTRDFGEVVIQARKGFVSLVGPRRTFARVQATTKNRVDLGLRIEGTKPGGRLHLSRIHETMKLQISFTKPEEVDSEALRWLRKAYDQNS
jgi:Domain of unknown function (DUF5655)